MVVKGNAGENNGKDGALEFLVPTLKVTLSSINFHHLRIFWFISENSEATADAIKNVKVEIYRKQITLMPAKA
ncbi:MAG: hypothetical protein KGS09_10040 [Nitrospirae bacterium]|nr:hypothetical protein [Nitrospirota bacterium]MBU6480867.1 hypothetical protein [Nitrospirota bacterium]MDE3049243.1 hypothetical protein [Nitrospirota bacterium]MDE3221786.1 hypothetical protein [Nitrospirota bacterium]